MLIRKYWRVFELFFDLLAGNRKWNASCNNGLQKTKIEN